MVKQDLQTLLAQNFAGLKSGWPTPKDEAWKYFDFKRLRKFEKWDVQGLTEDSSSLEIETVETQELSIKITPKTVQVSKALIDKGLSFSVSNKFEILNSKSKLDYRFLRINNQFPVLVISADSLRLEETVKLTYSCEGVVSQSVLGMTVLYDLKNSDLSICEFIGDSSLSPESFVSLATQARLQNSNFRQHIIQEGLSETQPLMYTSEAELGEDSHYNLFLISLAGSFVRNQNSVHILSEGSKAEVQTFVLAAQNSFSESRTEIAHFKEAGSSRQLFKAIVSDEAQAVFNGRIYIASEAQKTDSAQSCKGLLLGQRAQINAKPELEIYADDVKAAHGAAIGQVSGDEVFYLLSRGISPEVAYELLAQAFAGEVIQGITDCKIKKLVEDKIKSASAPIFADLVKAYQERDKKISKGAK